ncbi:hypothetical protein EVAR_59172_1 [Eumeta japonica]|uniref:Uncharacterized protein n=1 Tax=Eumeta variegata TaxID=151549 RepID=A0A4C1YTM5_EUMVA|nr:hypothetical protein EVAR_59172_1 [Eumeta japonica]
MLQSQFTKFSTDNRRQKSVSTAVSSRLVRHHFHNVFVKCNILYFQVEEIDSIIPEIPCTAAGGACVVAADCPRGHRAPDGLCPQQQRLGVECCYGISVRETRCRRHGGECTRSDCPDRLTYRDATDCNVGITLDNRLQWSPHINKLAKRLSSAAYAVKKMRNLSDVETARLVYFGGFHSLMSYGILLWGNSADIHRIFVLQKRAVRAIYKLGPRASFIAQIQTKAHISIDSDQTLTSHVKHTSVHGRRLQLSDNNAIVLSQTDLAYLCIQMAAR